MAKFSWVSMHTAIRMIVVVGEPAEGKELSKARFFDI
jgi:hypothetical protein